MANIIAKDMVSVQGGMVVFPHISGSFNASEGYESQAQLPLSTNINVGGGTLQILSNTCDGDTLITLRVNGVDSSVAITVAAGASGSFSFAGAPLAINGGDMINYKVDTSASSTSTSICISSTCLDY